MLFHLIWGIQFIDNPIQIKDDFADTEVNFPDTDDNLEEPEISVETE